MKLIYKIVKYVPAENIEEALKVERTKKANEVYMEEKSYERFIDKKSPTKGKPIGFKN